MQEDPQVFEEVSSSNVAFNSLTYIVLNSCPCSPLVPRRLQATSHLMAEEPRRPLHPDPNLIPTALVDCRPRLRRRFARADASSERFVRDLL
jgi:hypothetical protein